MTLATPVFPISGPQKEPRTEDYAAEANLLRIEGKILHALGQYGESARMYQLARGFDSVARRLQWVPARQLRERAA